MATRQSASDRAAQRSPANDGSREPHGKQPRGLENQNVTRPAPPPDAGEQGNRQPERSGLENQNVTKPDPVR